MESLCNQTLTGAEIVVASLVRHHVAQVFAYPGAASLPIHQVLLTSGLKVVVPRNEQGGAFAAGGYARCTGKAGVCMATSGPGATNLVTGIMDAYTDSIPLVVITAQVNQWLIGKNAFQETDIIGMTRLCVKHSFLVLDIKELAQAMTDAFQLAEGGRPGPVVVDIPRDVLVAMTDASFPEKASLRCYTTPGMPDEGLVQELHRLLEGSRRPVLYVGGGTVASGASEALRQFVEANSLPLTSSLMGIGSLPWNHCFNLRWLGMHGAYAANRAVHECDLLLALGVRFSDRVTGNIATFAPHAQIVHADIDPSEINKNKHADLPVVCDVKLLLERLLEYPPMNPRTRWLEEIRGWKEEHPFGYAKRTTSEVLGQEAIEALFHETGGDATVVTGVGQHQMWTAQFYGMSRPRHLLTSGGLGAMGFGLPAAIGAQLARPDDTVLLIDGDGSFQMNIQELATVFCERLPLKMVVLNNQMLGMVAQWEDYFYAGHHANTDMAVPAAGRAYPDFVAIARGYMIPGREVWVADDLVPAIRQMLETPGPFLLDIHIRSHEYVLPMIPPGKTCENIIV